LGCELPELATYFATPKLAVNDEIFKRFCAQTALQLSPHLLRAALGSANVNTLRRSRYRFFTPS